MRQEVSFQVTAIGPFKESLLQWAQQFEEIVWLDGNGHPSEYSSFDALLAVDALTQLSCDAQNAFQKLKEYYAATEDWIFGYLAYDLKNDVERLGSENPDHLDFPDLFFFQAKRIIKISGTTVSFHYLNSVSEEIKRDFESIWGGLAAGQDSGNRRHAIRIRMRIFKDQYFNKVQRMLAHIHRGDIYEANFCQEFYAEDTQIDPLETYERLNTISTPPFATFLRLRDRYILSASPERYMRKKGSQVVSQPIKGTSKRSSDTQEDEHLRDSLRTDEKERAENIMIVDLVRNDLAKSALKGSVKVEELCGVYTFKQVHQMISTVSSRVSDATHPVDILKHTFPMGSMTGAPKVSAMGIIEELESFKRGVYSGSVGYFSPSGDFDFNVIIRSILYNHTKRYVSFPVGSAITSKSLPEREYEECLLKAKAMREVLEGASKTET